MALDADDETAAATTRLAKSNLWVD